MAAGSDVSDLIGRRPLWRRWRLVTSVVLVGVILGVGYYGWFREQQTTAVTTTQEAKVTLGSLSTTLTASGTAAAEQSTPLTFNTGGLVTEVLVRLGEEVKAGQPLVRVDARDAQRAVENAQAALVQAQLRLDQLLNPSAVDRTSMQQSVVSARNSLEAAQATYNSLGHPTASELFAAEQAVASARASLDSAENSVSTSRSSLYSAQNNYCKLWQETLLGICTPDKLPINDEFVAMLEKSIARDRSVPSDSLISAVTSLLSANASHRNALASRESAAASVASAELKLKDLTTPTAEAIRNARAAVENAQASYDSVLARADALVKPTQLDLSVQQQAVRSAEIALQTAKDTLADTTLVAPFSGKAGTVSAVVGQRIGSGTAAVVLSNPDAIRLDLTIAETDLVNVKAGMLGLARFDSMPRSVYVVRVMGVSAVPTVTQGVVTYPVQAAILRGNALNDIRDQIPSLTRALTSGAAGAQFGAALGTGGGPGGGGAGGAAGAGGQRPQRPQGASGASGASGPSGASGATGSSGAQGQRGPGAGASGASGATGATGATGGSGPRGGGGAAGASGATGAGGAGGAAGGLFNSPLPAAGMNASVTLLVSVVENQLLVPSGAVRRQGNQTFVYTPATEAGGAPVQKAVVTGGTDGTNTAITTGLAEGDTVLLGAIGTATPTATRSTNTQQGGGFGGGPGGHPVIELHDVAKTYLTGAGPVYALRGADLTIERGEFVAIMGQSGSGKSTMMNILGLLDRPSSGRYLLEGQDVSDLDADERARLRGHEFGFVFQSYNLIPRLSAVEQVELPLVYQGVRERRERAAKALLRVGLDASFHGRGPTQLSGGQQQRVAIARSIVVEPRVMLADEPTGALDTATSAEVMTLFRELVEQQGITVIIVTHEPDIAALTDRTVRMVDGRIVEDAGRPQRHQGEASA